MVYEYYAKVLRVVDGDTIEADISLGFDIHLAPRLVRLYGLNAPETHDKDAATKKRAQAATEFLREKLLPNDPTLTPTVKLQTQKPDSTDKYGRLLATVFYLPVVPKKKSKKAAPVLVPAWTNINEESLAAGHTKAYFGAGEKPI